MIINNNFKNLYQNPYHILTICEVRGFDEVCVVLGVNLKKQLVGFWGGCFFNYIIQSFL